MLLLVTKNSCGYSLLVSKLWHLIKPDSDPVIIIFSFLLFDLYGFHKFIVKSHFYSYFFDKGNLSLNSGQTSPNIGSFDVYLPTIIKVFSSFNNNEYYSHPDM